MGNLNHSVSRGELTMTLLTINSKAAVSGTLAEEMDSWLSDIVLSQHDINTLHINDTFPAFTSFKHYINLIADKTIGKYHMEILNFHVKNDSDLDEFLGFYHGSDSKMEIESNIESYHNFKLAQNHLSLGGFLFFFEHNPIQALVKLFQRNDIKQYEMDLLNNKLENGEITPTIVYEASKDAWYNSIGKIVRADWSDKLVARMAI
jgi:hypothetical protein